MKNKQTLESILRINYPILQGAMANISDSSLVSAVSEAGGLGILASGNMEPEEVREEIRKTKSKTSYPFGVNVIISSKFCDQIIDVLHEEKVDIVITGNGDPGKFFPKFNAWNMKVIPVVSSYMMAKRMEKLGAIAVIAEGMEAGGHIGSITTMCLLPNITKDISIPVIAAGGIASGYSMMAAFNLGAQGVQIGTRFLLAKECNIHTNYKKRVIDSNDFDSVVIKNMINKPIRSLRNKLTNLIGRLELEYLKNRSTSIEDIDLKTINALSNAVKNGDVQNGLVMAGQISAVLTKEETCKEIMCSILNEWNSCTEKTYSKYDLPQVSNT
ncbi:mutanobactin A biosynthesis reductase MubJ [Streptococcus mutans]|uniref:mutanobactin A biosynthesis reductase MubJ n=1 Tax=Streptococcus mutans TaxID=1309 RepID=UPI00232A88BC|nr:mutanobactin A biosynthesis reductase MubJ [Streptococcus mutans]MDB8635210.1 mutanobactin A biosynthesis reductase MubJ [Streptococcus mutans]MDB8639722.1 mutanobactin A biosynthesis reductase MubJ [Streptococcus mutans]MDB8641381.1 mutanobactin A biosynthesis reductase MubJ [Streptococcus mutans]